MIGQRIGVRIRNEFINNGKINSLTGRGRISRRVVKLEFSTIDTDELTNKTTIPKTDGGIKNDNVLIKTDIRGMFPKLGDP